MSLLVSFLQFGMEQSRPIKRKASLIAAAHMQQVSEVPDGPFRLKGEPMPPLTQEAQKILKEYHKELDEVRQKVEARHARQKKAAKIVKLPVSKKSKKQELYTVVWEGHVLDPEVAQVRRRLAEKWGAIKVCIRNCSNQKLTEY